MTTRLRPNRQIDAFAIIVDINSFTPMVYRSAGNAIAQFTRDVLEGSISAIEEQDGHVVGFMGDAILGLIDDPKKTYIACSMIAKDLDAQCSWISNGQQHDKIGWAYSPGGPSLKIGVEYGKLDVSAISSKCLGNRLLVIGNAINYAARITKPGSGNRCHVGPEAAAMGLKSFPLQGPRSTRGKAGEGEYSYFKLDLSDIWIEGPRRKGTRSSWE